MKLGKGTWMSVAGSLAVAATLLVAPLAGAMPPKGNFPPKPPGMINPPVKPPRTKPPIIINKAKTSTTKPGKPPVNYRPVKPKPPISID